MPEGERRLAAIMFTDMVGYTALGQRNETLSLALVEEQRRLIRPILRRHSGREVKTIGDAFLVEFTNALDAARCAYDIQRAAREFNISLPSEKRIHLRAGLHLGDVVESQGDISGDAVNVASRIEALAEDGGVCLTRQVYDQVKNKFELQLVSLGAKGLKNVSEPIEVFSVVMPWEKEMAASSTMRDTRRIAVLPFTNMSPDPNDEYFADGMTEELISTVSKIRGLTVISRTSVMKFKGTGASMEEIGRALNVGSAVEGSVRKSGSNVRITAQLIDVGTDGHLWSQTYDRELNDIFAIQSDIAQTVAESLKVRLISSERQDVDRRATQNAQAYVLYLKGRHYWNERTKDGTHRALNYFQEAIKLDPAYALGYSGLADCYFILAQYGFEVPSENFRRTKELAEQALHLDEKLAEAHASLASALFYLDFDVAGAEREYRRAIELNPNYASAHQWYYLLLACQERWDEAYSELQKALDLDPSSPIIGCNLAEYSSERRDFQKAIEQYRKVLEMDPSFAEAHWGLFYDFLQTSRYEEAQKELDALDKLSPSIAARDEALVAFYAKNGRTEEAREILTRLEERSITNEYVDAVGLAELRFMLGDNDRGFEWLERAYQERDGHIPYIRISWPLDGVRSDPRYLSLLKRIGLE